MGQFAGHGHGVAVQRHAGVVAHGGQFGHRLEHARLVVAQHHADQPGLWAQERGEALHADDAVAADAEGVEPEALFQQVFGRSDDAGVFDGRDDDLSGGSAGTGDAQDGQVIGLGAAAVKISRSGCGPARSPPRMSAIRPRASSRRRRACWPG